MSKRFKVTRKLSEEPVYKPGDEQASRSYRDKLQVNRSFHTTNIEEAVREINSTAEQAESKVKQLEEKITHLESKIEAEKFKAIEVIGIFIALFTFLSAQIGIFTYAKNLLQALGLSFTFGGMIILFVIVLEVIVGSNNSIATKSNILFRFLTMILVCCLFVYIGMSLLSTSYAHTNGADVDEQNINQEINKGS